MKKVKDHYYKLAKDQNYSARSVFKLEEIDKKYQIIKRGMTVLDLGASPGSWTEYTLKKLGPKGKMIAIDLKPLQKTFSDQVYFIEKNIFKLSGDDFPMSNIQFDLVMSDMAPNTTGNKGLNHQKSLDLCSEVIKICDQYLKPNSNLICKGFQGVDFQEFIIEEIKPRFNRYKLFKPGSSRKESVEIFIIGFSYKDILV